MRLKKRILPIIAILPLLPLSIQVKAQPPDPPEGKVWILNVEMSDEFDANSPGDKWRIYDKADSWNRTAAFDKRVQEVVQVVEDGKENYILAMNPMWYEEEDIFTKNGRTYFFAGGGMDTRSMATYGYFEVRIKPSDFPMGSGVFMNSRGFSDGPCGEKYKTELDIIENMGYTGPGASDYWNNIMHVNTHVKPTDTDCSELPYLSTGGGLGKPLVDPLGFNVVGAWWKNRDSVDYYLNGEYFQTIEFIRDFYVPMPVILTMETYTWGSDENNADNPKPVEYMFQDSFRTREQRAVHYDWVRTWQLADIDTSEFNLSIDNLGFYQKPDTMWQDSILDLTVLYSATNARDIIVTLFDSTSAILGSDTLHTVAGVGSVNATLDMATLLPIDDNYWAVCDIRPAGGDGASVLATDTTNLVVEARPEVTLVKADSFPKQVYPSDTGYTVKVVYEGAENMEVAVELRDPSGAWIGGGLQVVPDGNGIASIPVALIAATVAGTGYYWKTHIRPVGSTWMEAVHGLQYIPFQVIEKLVDGLSIHVGAGPILTTNIGVEVGVDYSTTIDADVKLFLVNAETEIISDTAASVETGKGRLEFLLLFSEVPVPGSDYMLVSGLYATGKDSLIASDTLRNLQILDASDSIRITEAPVSLPFDTSLVKVVVRYYALQESEISAGFYSSGGDLIALGVARVSAGGGTADVLILLNYLQPADSNYFIVSLKAQDNPSVVLAADTVTEVIIRSDPTGIAATSGTSPLKIYPNPASGMLTVEISRSSGRVESLFISDVSGKTVWMANKAQTDKHQGRIDCDISSLKNGIYIVKMITANRLSTSVLVVH